MKIAIFNNIKSFNSKQNYTEVNKSKTSVPFRANVLQQDTVNFSGDIAQPNLLEAFNEDKIVGVLTDYLKSSPDQSEDTLDDIYKLTKVIFSGEDKEKNLLKFFASLKKSLAESGFPEYLGYGKISNTDFLKDKDNFKRNQYENLGSLLQCFELIDSLYYYDYIACYKHGDKKYKDMHDAWGLIRPLGTYLN